MTTTNTPRWKPTQFSSALLEHDGETCNEIYCSDKDEAECLVDLLNELTERAERAEANLRRAVEIAVNLSYDYADTEYDEELDQLGATINTNK